MPKYRSVEVGDHPLEGTIRESGRSRGTRSEREQRARAAAFRRVERWEHIVKVKRDDPATFAKLTPSIKMQLGFYVRDREAALEQGLIDEEGHPVQ